MRRVALSLLASSAFAMALGQVAVAASTKKPKPPPIPMSVLTWTGFYVGADAGGRWSDADFTSDPFSFTRLHPGNPPGVPPFAAGHPFNIPGRSESFNSQGGIFGLHGGYNHQFDPSWLAGIELDFSWADHSKTNSFSTTDGFTLLTLTRTSTLKMGSQGSVRGRFGWVNNQWLLYGTGGVSFMQAQWTESWSPVILLTNPALPFAVSSDKIYAGATFGGGAEYRFLAQWTLRAEYLFTEYGRISVPLALTTNSGRIDLQTSVARVGLTYLLGPRP